MDISLPKDGSEPRGSQSEEKTPHGRQSGGKTQAGTSRSTLLQAVSLKSPVSAMSYNFARCGAILCGG